MLNTNHPKHLIYSTKMLVIEVLGGINLNHLDKLRVTLKIYKPDTIETVRDSVDLYHYTQVEKLLIALAERLRISSTTVRKHLLELTDALETYRLTLVNTPKQTYELSPLHKKKAISFLKSKKLLENTNTLIGQSGIVGEVNNRLLMYLIFTSRKTSYPLHCVSLGKSGTGKSHLQNGIGNLMPPEDVLEITSLSANALYYFEEKELNDKVLLIEDLDGAAEALYPIRELQSKRRLTKTVVQTDKQGDRKTIHVTVEGKVSIAGCTTKEAIYEDNSNRAFLLYIDESVVQEDRIIHYQQQVAAKLIDTVAQEEAVNLLRDVQRVLEPITIRNPYATKLKLPKSILKRRRTNAHYLGFIEAITFYHQFQRKQQTDKKTGEKYIETTKEDIILANEMILDALVHKSDVLTNATRKYYEQLEEYLQKTNHPLFSARDVRRSFRISKTSQWRYHQQLLEYGYLEKLVENKQVFYKLIPVTPLEALKTSIKEQLQASIVEI